MMTINPWSEAANQAKFKHWTTTVEIHNILKDKRKCLNVTIDSDKSKEGLISLNAEKNTISDAIKVMTNYDISSIPIEFTNLHQHSESSQIEAGSHSQVIAGKKYLRLHLKTLIRFVLDSMDMDAKLRDKTAKDEPYDEEASYWKLMNAPLARIHHEYTLPLHPIVFDHDKLSRLITIWTQTHSTAVLVSTHAGSEPYSVLTPMDFLRYLHHSEAALGDIMTANALEVLKIAQPSEEFRSFIDPSASEKHSRLMESNLLMAKSDSAYNGLRKLTINPAACVGIVNDEQLAGGMLPGALIAHLSPSDFLPLFADELKPKSLESKRQLLQQPVLAFLSGVAKKEPEKLEAFTLHDNFDMDALICKMLLLSVHQLWYVHDQTKKPVLVITIPSILSRLFNALGFAQ